jgi:hypothetical protein
MPKAIPVYGNRIILATSELRNSRDYQPPLGLALCYANIDVGKLMREHCPHRYFRRRLLAKEPSCVMKVRAMVKIDRDALQGNRVKRFVTND